jgi:hypothetical protein
MKKVHEIQHLIFDKNRMLLTVDGQQHVFDLSKVSNRLANAGKIERETYQISPSGYGVHWPLLDEDLSINGLLGISHKPINNKHTEPKSP